MQDTLDQMFSPKSIALVGIPRGFKSGKVFLMGLLEQGFTGPIYLIHPSSPEIDGFPTYRNLLQIPDPVDMVIILSPRETVFDVLRECAQKQVKAVILYTSGFAELGGKEGRAAENGMRQIALDGGFRILGPNCMGVYSPASHVAPFPGMPKTPGSLGFISQSGSLMNLFVTACSRKDIFFSHAVSYGNGADVGLTDLLAWMGKDEQTRVLCSYCEGVEEPRNLIPALRETAGRKPFIMWKVGLTGAGSRAAASHTGAMTGEGPLWKSLFRQFHVLDVYDIEEMSDLATAFYHLRPPVTTGRVVIVSGPGGPAVSAADAVERNGLTMAALGRGSLDRLKALLPPTGTSWANPVDVGLGASFDLRLYEEALNIILDDPGVDTVLMLGGGATAEMSTAYVHGLIAARENTNKPIIAIAYPGFIQIDQEDLLSPLRKNGIPVYTTPERALRAYARMLDYYRFQGRQG